MFPIDSTSSKQALGRRAVAAAIVVALAVAGMLVATALASTSTHKSSTSRSAKVSDIAVLRGHGSALRARKAATAFAPAGSVLAAVFGETEVFALHNSGNEDCVIHLTAGAGGGSICGAAAKVEAEGEVAVGGGPGPVSGGIGSVRVSALVPDGVSSLTFTDRDGTKYVIAVTNNVVEHEDANLASVSYALPSGAIKTTNVAAVVDQLPTQPGAPGSSS